MRHTRWTGPPLIIAAAVLVAVVAPGMLGRYGADVALSLCIYAGLAQAWNLLGGFGGQFSLGLQLFIGIGAYGQGLLLVRAEVPTALAMLAGTAVAALIGVLLVRPLFRLRGVYFSVGTLAAATALQVWMTNWDYAGAAQGLSLPLDSALDPFTTLRVAALLLVAVTVVAWLLTTTSFGLRLMAVRDNEDAASGLGVDGFRLKGVAFVLSAAFAGAFGTVIAQQQITLQPDAMFGIGWTISMIVMTIVGGAGTWLGPLVGAFIVYYGLTTQLEGSGSLAALLTGLLLIVVIRFAPAGVVPLAQQVLTRVRARPHLRPTTSVK